MFEDVNLISSRSTFFYKRVVPIVWFGILGAFALAIGIGRFPQMPNNARWFVVGVFVMLTVFGYVVMKSVVFGLVDEVWDGGDELIVRNKGREERIALADCLSLSYKGFMNPPRITLLLWRNSEFGTEISFIPPFRVFPYSMPAFAKDLILRIDDARKTSKA